MLRCVVLCCVVWCGVVWCGVLCRVCLCVCVCIVVLSDVDAAFGGDAKAAADTMIEAIRLSFEQGLPDLAWMDAETQEQVSDESSIWGVFGVYLDLF